jgi:[ribosomal protein S18]-alanine N-acetyltransferase
MSARPRPAVPLLLPMSTADVDAVIAIENALYDFPWTHGNFIDSLHAGHLASVLRDGSTTGSTAGGAAPLLGYMVAMSGLDEMHLLNLSVAAEVQGRGHARRMLDSLCRQSALRGARQLWLEVRPSNQRALLLYERYGFARTGLRRGYYPDHGRQREDAVVMSLDLSAAGPHGLG